LLRSQSTTGELSGKPVFDANQGTLSALCAVRELVGLVQSESTIKLTNI